MPDTFDPRPFAGGPACVQFLRGEYEIRVSQRLGARLVSLARRHIQLSLALLEAATPGSDLEQVLLDEAWNGCATAPEAALRVGCWGRAMDDGGLIKVVAPDEVSEESSASVARVSAPLPASPALALAVASSSSPVARQRELDGGPWDDERLREAARTLFDSEDASELVETLRRLFRAALGAGLDPVALLALALRRDKRVLRLEAGALTRHHLDRETGRAIEDLQSEEEARIRDAIHVLLRVKEGAPLARLVLPAITPLLGDLRALRQVITMLPQAIHLVTDEDAAEPFLDALLDQLTDLESPERFTLSRFLLAAQDVWPTLPSVLFGRLRSTVDSHVQAWYGNVLARMRLDEALRERLIETLVDLYERQGHDVALAERLKVTFLFLGARPLELLTERARTLEHGMQRSYLVDLWITYLNGSHPHPSKALLAEFLAAEIASRNRAAILVMIRSGTATSGHVDLLAEPALIDHLQSHGWVREPAIGVLLEEAVHLDDPDDLGALGLLARLGRPAVEAAFERAREEAALDSRAAPYRFRVFAYVAAKQPQSAWLTEMAEVALGWPFLRRHDLPVTVTGLGLLGRVPGVAEEALSSILDPLLPLDPEVAVTFAEARVRAALEMYESPTCPPTVREAVESRLERIVAAAAPARDLLVAALLGLDTLMSRPSAPLRVDPICVTLARMVLQKSRETSLDRVLAEALRDEAEGHGVRVPTAWSKEDRDFALTILGKAAAHPEVLDRLHRMIAARLASFTEDWLDAHERGENLYLHRDTPLWRIMLDLVDQRPSEHAVEAVVRVGLRALEVQRQAPQNLALERREEIQRLLGHLTWLAPQEPVEVRGSLSLDIPKTALATLTTLATRDNENARLILEEIAPRVPERLRPQLDGFLSFMRRRYKT